jgi:hypothetical protein
MAKNEEDPNEEHVTTATAMRDYRDLLLVEGKAHRRNGFEKRNRG